jgi:hypothetical protein
MIILGVLILSYRVFTIKRSDFGGFKNKKFLFEC